MSTRVAPPATGRALDREILTLAVPALATLVAEPLLILADTMIIGHVGTAQLAGLTLASNIIGVVVGLSVFLAYGTTATVGRRLGAQDRAGAIAAGIDGMVLGAVVGVVVFALLQGFGPALLSAYHADATTTAYALTYLRLVSCGLPAQLIMLAATGLLRGLQDTRTPLVVVVTINLLNIALNASLVFGAGLGIAGSGLGTAISQWLGCLAMTTVVLRGARRSGTPARINPLQVLAAARSAGWLLLRNASLQAAIVITTLTAAALGQAALAAHQIATSLWTASAYALDAFAIAAQAMISVRLGAGDTAGTRAVLRRIATWSAGFGIVVGIALVLVRGVAGHVFSPDPTVRAQLAPALLMLALALPIGGITFVLDGVLIGAGDARYLALAGLVTTLLYAPAAWAVHQAGAGLATLWLAYAGWIAARAITLGVRAVGGRWMRLGA